MPSRPSAPSPAAPADLLDPARVRARFPAMRSGLVFFDNPGGTQVPQSVSEAVSRYLEHQNANVGGAFATSRATDRVLEAGRAAMADFLGCEATEIVFGANMTTLTMALARSLARELGPGDEVLVTRLDHDANISPWLAIAEDRDLVVRFVDFEPEDCTLRPERFESLLSDRTRLVAVGYASNAVGTVNPVRRIVEIAHSAGALCFVDAVQFAPHGAIDVRDLGCDFLAVSAYKFFGPHVGVLYGKREQLERLHPYKVRPASDRAPQRWETGTLCHEGIAGTTAAVDYLAGFGAGKGRRERLVSAMHRIQDLEVELCAHLLAVLAGVEGVRVYGITRPERARERVPTVAFTLAGQTPRQVAERLGEAGICVWEGHYYAVEVVRALGLEDSGGMVRVGLAHYNTRDEIERLGEILSGM